MTEKTIFISADLGYSLTYFLQSDVVPKLRAAGVRIVLLTDDGFVKAIAQDDPGLIVESLRFKQCREYAERVDPGIQSWLHFLRWMGGSNRINTQPMDAHLRQVEHKPSSSNRRVLPLIRALTFILRRSALARKLLIQAQMRYTPRIYSDLFEKYQPVMVISASPGWRLDRYLLREAAARNTKIAVTIVGWDNPSSYRLPGSKVDYATCWSEIQKDELVRGSDWNPARVNVGGIPSYDNYLRRTWVIPRDEYFQHHGLDPRRKLLAYACSFVNFSPNYANVLALAELVSQDKLAQPAQLLIRLHPSHFHPGTVFEKEAEEIRQLAARTPHVHVVDPKPLGDQLRYYSGEDMPEKASLMTHADVFLTVYSTMVVEAAVHDRPIVSVCMDKPGGWGDKFTLPFAEIGGWPTHARFREVKAGRVAFNQDELRAHIDFYLADPQADHAERVKFIQDECTFTDGSAGQRTAAYLLSLLEK